MPDPKVRKYFQKQYNQGAILKNTIFHSQIRDPHLSDNYLYITNSNSNNNIA